ncbi:hypothetical protein SISSUDRAFT_1046096 [Sistotremastrum suecicum HHB10207 ss-3]|uniref:Uncharacterized protein n=1 Tax=Sistotremastrum suecicum HHB10207 ss-3 TaxID=1314776 RepID=A0A166DZ81_9AGAM|nr:hypothetical protein SISSUDRAFT_1046096 [Sistotremastrum suecicum HHB10207 ss-3]
MCPRKNPFSSRFVLVFTSVVLIHALTQLPLLILTLVFDINGDRGIRTAASSSNPSFDSFARNSTAVYTSSSSTNFSVQLCPDGISPGPLCTVIFPLDPSNINKQSKALVFLWPFQNFELHIREDVLLIILQVWLLATSLHFIFRYAVASLVTAFSIHTLTTIWSLLVLLRNQIQKKEIVAVFSSLFPRPFDPGNYKLTLDALKLSFNLVVLGVISFLGWRSLKIIGKAGDPYSCSSRTLIKKIQIGWQASSHLAVFFTASSAVLWIDRVFNLSSSIRLPVLFYVSFGGLLALLPLWIFLLYRTIQNTSYQLFVPHLLLSVLFLGSYAGLFVSPLFRWLFQSSLFIAIVTVCELTFMTVSLVMSGFWWWIVNNSQAWGLRTELDDLIKSLEEPPKKGFIEEKIDESATRSPRLLSIQWLRERIQAMSPKTSRSSIFPHIPMQIPPVTSSAPTSRRPSDPEAGGPKPSPTASMMIEAFTFMFRGSETGSNLTGSVKYPESEVQEGGYEYGYGYSYPRSPSHIQVLPPTRRSSQATQLSWYYSSSASEQNASSLQRIGSRDVMLQSPPRIAQVSPSGRSKTWV